MGWDLAERTTSECLTLLGLEKPKLAGKTQDEVDTKLTAWKADILKPAFKAKAHEVHPDKNPDDSEAGAKFLAVKEAFEQLQNLTVTLKRPENKCPSGHPREPVTAKFCHECGYSYVEDALVHRLRAAGIHDTIITEMQNTGKLAELRKMDPFSPELSTEILMLQQRQRLGLFGRYSGWR
jgi:hypothetical protein